VNGSWHKGSRYWRIGLPLVAAVDLLCAAVLAWRPELGGDALGAVTTVTTVFLVGGGGKSVVGEINRPKFQGE